MDGRTDGCNDTVELSLLRLDGRPSLVDNLWSGSWVVACLKDVYLFICNNIDSFVLLRILAPQQEVSEQASIDAGGN